MALPFHVSIMADLHAGRWTIMTCTRTTAINDPSNNSSLGKYQLAEDQYVLSSPKY